MQRRSLLMSAAALAAFEPLMAEAQEQDESTTLKDIPLGPNVKLTIQRRGQVVLSESTGRTFRIESTPKHLRASAEPITITNTIPRCGPRSCSATDQISRAESTSMLSPRGFATPTHPRPQIRARSIRSANRGRISQSR